MPTILSIKAEGHPHRLELRKSEVPFYCDGCEELGFGLRYMCPNNGWNFFWVHNGCDFTMHEECGSPRLPELPFLERCHRDFEFYSKIPLPGSRVFCEACGLDIRGFLYQCKCREPHYLHPCCTKLPSVFSRSDINMEIRLREVIKSKCWKCHRKKRPGNVQGWAYESSDGKYSCHVACMKEACLEKWKIAHFEPNDVAIDKNKKVLALENPAPNEVAAREGGQRSKAGKGIKILITFLKLVVSAIFGDPVSLIWNVYQLSQI